jgi:hypothetical protein
MLTHTCASLKMAVFILWLISIQITATAQVRDSTLYRIQTVDENVFVGIILSQDNEMLELSTALFGVIIIKKINIKSMVVVDAAKLKEGTLWFDNPQSTRYFWQPNGYGLKKGEAYYQNVWVLFNQVSFGMSDYFTIGGGVVPLFLVGADVTPVWINPKFSIPVVENKFNIGAGALVGTLLGQGGSDASFGIAYGIATMGNRDSNLSLGLGYGFAAGEMANRPAVTLSGMLRTGPRGYLLTENYIISTDFGTEFLLLVGGRRIIKNAGIDFGLLMPSTSGSGFIGIPWLGITVPFGN